MDIGTGMETRVGTVEMGTGSHTARMVALVVVVGTAVRTSNSIIDRSRLIMRVR